jgi:signal transduction histidine kinase
MVEQLSKERLEKKIKRLEKEILERKQAEEMLLEKQSDLITILENSPIMMFLVDREKRVRNAAHAVEEFTGKRAEEILGRRGGEVLRCFHAQDDPKGCGFGPACETCEVRQMVTDAFETGQDHYRTEVMLPLERDGEKTEMNFYVSAALLASQNQELVLVSIEDITERRQAERALLKAKDDLEKRVEERTSELQDLSSKLLVAHEEESKRIGRELHDGLAQTLSAIKVWVEAALSQVGQDNLAEMTKSLESVVPLAQNAVEEVRRISKNLRPAILDDFGIIATVSWLCQEFETIYSGIGVEREIDLKEIEVPDMLKIVIFRISQEALNNIAKHSQANRVHLSLKKRDSIIELTISDNGTGFDVEQVLSGELPERGLGLASMRERATLSGGTFFIESHKGAGTTVRALWQKVKIPSPKPPKPKSTI